MNKQDKLKAMWADIDQMSEEQIMVELHKMNVPYSKEVLLEKLGQTFHDLSVADWIFETCAVDDSHSPYPKEFVDEAITRLARLHEFPFTHYGIISQDLYALHAPFITKQDRLQKQKRCFQQLFQLCKRFHLDFFDNVVYVVQDDLDIGKEFLFYLNALQEEDTPQAHREVQQMIERFFQCFAQMNPWMEEQLQLEQAESLVAMKSAKGEKLFQQLIKTCADPDEAIYHYARCYQKKDAKKAKSIVSRYQKEIIKDSEFYAPLQKLLKS